MRFTPNSDAVVQEMLNSIGLQQLEQLFDDVPDQVQMKRPLDLPPNAKWSFTPIYPIWPERIWPLRSILVF